MTNHDHEPNREALSEAQQKFIDAVGRLAIEPGGPCGVERSGSRPASPGLHLVAYAAKYDETGTDYFCITICVEPDKLDGPVEALWVDPAEAKTHYQVSGGWEPFWDKQSVPDEAIDSFLQRHGLVE